MQGRKPAANCGELSDPGLTGKYPKHLYRAYTFYFEFLIMRRISQRLRQCGEQVV